MAIRTGEYKISFLGIAGVGEGAITITHDGNVSGADYGGGVYQGRLREEGGRLRGLVNLTMPRGGNPLVTGQVMRPGQSIPIQIDWPAAFENGQHQVTVNGGLVTVAVHRIG